MSRMLSWKRGYTYAGTVWTTKVHSNWYNNINLSFTIEASMYGGIVDTNAKLIVRKCKPGRKIATEVILVKEFDTGYKCKDYIDGLLIVSNLMFSNEPQESNKAELWFLEQLRNTPDAPMPEQPDHIRTGGWYYNNGRGRAR